MRLIDADALYKRLKNDMRSIPLIEEDRDMFYHYSGYNCAMTGAYLEVEKQPTVDAVEVVHGRWIKNENVSASDMFLSAYYDCSECGEEISDRYGLYAYCPFCGAKMDGE